MRTEEPGLDIAGQLELRCGRAAVRGPQGCVQADELARMDGAWVDAEIGSGHSHQAVRAK